MSLLWETESADDPSKKVFRKLAYTHAHDYEEAMDKLMPKLSQHMGLPLDDRYFIVWGVAPHRENLTDVTNAVVLRIRKNNERWFKRTEKEA